MNKNFFIIPIIVFVVLVIVFIIVFSGEYRETIKGAVMEPAENYIIKEVNGETIVENENVGLTVRIPEGWQVEKKEIGEDEWIVNLTSPDAVLNESGMLKDGCGVSIGVIYDKIVYGVLLDLISDPIEDYEIVVISGKNGLSLSEETSVGTINTVKVPFKDKIYSIESLGLNRDDYCAVKLQSIIDNLIIF